MISNDRVADALRAHAAELARRGDNLYRVRAFRQAAFAVLASPSPVAGRSPDDLARVPGIGKSLAATIHALATGDTGPDRVTLLA